MARSESCRPSVVGVGNDAEDRENRKDSVDQIQQPGLDVLDRDRSTEARRRSGDCSYEIYVCDCGNWERDTRRTFWENGDRNHCKSMMPRNRATKPYYHKCPDCRKQMRIADFEKDLLTCLECGEKMRNIKPIIHWS